MPIYEYRCSSCGAEQEALQKFSDPLLVTCASCGKDALVKQVSAAGFQLKGSGWYVTDFRNGSKPASKSDANKESGSEGSSADGAKKDGDAKNDSAAKKDGEPKKDSTASAATPAKGESAAATPASSTPPPKPASSE